MIKPISIQKSNIISFVFSVGYLPVDLVLVSYVKKRKKYFYLLYLLRFIWELVWMFSRGRAHTCIPLTEDFCSGKITVFNWAYSFRRDLLNCNWVPIILVKLMPLGIYLEKLFDFCMIKVAEQEGWSYSSASEVKRILSQAPGAGQQIEILVFAMLNFGDCLRISSDSSIWNRNFYFMPFYFGNLYLVFVFDRSWLLRLFWISKCLNC